MSDKLEDVVRLVYTYYKLQITQLQVVYTSTSYLAANVTHHLHCFVWLVVHNIDVSNVGPPSCLSLVYGLPAIGSLGRAATLARWVDSFRFRNERVNTCNS